MKKINRGEPYINMQDFKKYTPNESNTGISKNKIPDSSNTGVGIGVCHETYVLFDIEVHGKEYVLFRVTKVNCTGCAGSGAPDIGNATPMLNTAEILLDGN